MKSTNLAALVFLVLLAFSLAGCGESGSAGNTALKGISWAFENDAPDYANSGATCFLSVRLYYDPSLAQSDIVGFTLTSPVGWHWTVPSVSSNNFGTTGTRPYVTARFYYGASPHTFPLAGVWSAELVLASGARSSGQLQLHDPGTNTTATRQYVYTKEDWNAGGADQYAALLGRFPAQGFTVQYASLNGGSIYSTGFPAVRSAYLAAEPNAYNSYCWLYDANKTYLGYTASEYSSVDHTKASLIDISGELSIVPSSTRFTAGTVNLSAVKYIRVVCTDGAQFAPGSYSTYDNRSVSALIPVQ